MKRGQRLISNAARRDVDDAVEAGFVDRVMHEAHERDDVLDFAASVKSLCAHEAIGKPRLQEGFFN